MNLRRDQLILLGWIGIGLTVDDWLGPLGYIVAWLIARRTRSTASEANQLQEAMALIAGSLIGGWLSGKLGSSGQFFLGHGLAAVQFVRIRRRVTARETWSMLLITLLHLGVVCTTILDIRFLLIFIAAVVLAPRALAEISATDFSKAAPPAVFVRSPTIGWVNFMLIGGLSILLFALFPRAALGSGWRGPATRGGPGSLLDSLMDPSRSGFANSRKILMQVQADNLGYLRCLGFTDFDGEFWSRHSEGGLTQIPPISNPSAIGKLSKRMVRVKHVQFLKRNLPSDGRVSRMQGNFFRRAFKNVHQLVEVETPIQRTHNVYEYWTDLGAKPEPLPAALRTRSLALPKVSPLVRTWLDGILAGQSDPLEKAKTLEKHLRDHFKYQLGAPELNRLSQLEDFLFVEKRGHCERFASTLALLLRMEGVPTRIIAGYAPGERNWISGWYDIRFSDAHAWTEAWFENKGWVTLDATPRATTPPPANTLADLFEALDFAWYAHVVNLDAPTQNELISNVASYTGNAVRSLAQHTNTVLSASAIVVMLAFAVALARRQRAVRPPAPTQSERFNREIRHHYDEMLAALERRGIQRLPCQTPQEYLQSIDQADCPCREEAAYLTELFCRTRYGTTTLQGTELETSRHALEQIKSWSRTQITPRPR